MSFEILSISGEPRLLSAVNFPAHPTPSDADQYAQSFVDDQGHRYSAFFDGRNVIFNDGAADFIGRWLLGTSATVIQRTGRLPDVFTFTFMDHGPGPQRLHAVWTFPGSVEEAIAGWKLAGFSVSNVDRHWNRNHLPSIHLRTRGAFGTGAESSHVLLPVAQTESHTTGHIHVGEFNPLTGFGIGFILHHLESCAWKPRSPGR